MKKILKIDNCHDPETNEIVKGIFIGDHILNYWISPETIYEIKRQTEKNPGSLDEILTKMMNKFLEVVSIEIGYRIGMSGFIQALEEGYIDVKN